MVKTFKSKETELLANGFRVKKYRNIEDVARRKLVMLKSATDLGDLKVPPGNKLEKLKKDREGQHSIRINDQWRICFVWKEGDAYNVEIVDYH